MNCEEFLRQFRDALEGKVSENVIQDNVKYYRSYINSQTAGGRSESDVLGMLGDPRLLAKTIEESSKFVSDRESQGGRAGDFGNYSSAKSSEYPYTDTSDAGRVRLPGWLITCIVVAVVFLILSVVFRMFVFMAPYIILFLLAGFLFRAVRSWLQRK